MSSWLISIVGIVVVGVIVELLLSDSNMSRFVRSIWGFFLLLVIVQPIPGFVRNLDVGNVEIDWDWGLIGQINTQSATGLARNTELGLANSGFENVLITIKPNMNSTSFQVSEVHINASAVTVRHNRPNINTQDEIIRIVRLITRATDNQIIFFGG